MRVMQCRVQAQCAEQVKNDGTHVRRDNKYVVRPLLVKSENRETAVSRGGYCYRAAKTVVCRVASQRAPMMTEVKSRSDVKFNGGACR